MAERNTKLAAGLLLTATLIAVGLVFIARWAWLRVAGAGALACAPLGVAILAGFDIAAPGARNRRGPLVAVFTAVVVTIVLAALLVVGPHRLFSFSSGTSANSAATQAK